MNPGITVALTLVLALLLAMPFLVQGSHLDMPNRAAIHVLERTHDLAAASEEPPAWSTFLLDVEPSYDVDAYLDAAYDEAVAEDFAVEGDATVEDVERSWEALPDRTPEPGVAARLRVYAWVLPLVTAAGLLLVLAWVLRGRRWAPVGDADSVAPWSAGEGYGVAVRAAVLGFLLAIAFSEIPVAGMWTTLFASAGLVWFVHRRLLRPRMLGWRALGLGPPRNLRFMAGAVLGVLALDIAGVNLISRACANAGMTYHWTELVIEELVFGSAATAIFASADVVLWAPLFEEIGFRGFVYPTMRARMGVAPAVVLSAAIFAAIHMYSPTGMLSILWGGILLALLREKTRSLWPCVACHALWNLYSTATLTGLYR